MRLLMEANVHWPAYGTTHFNQIVSKLGILKTSRTKLCLDFFNSVANRVELKLFERN